MKKFLLVCCMMAVAMTASAQFTEFRSIYTTPQPSYTPSPGYGVPFSTYESLQSHQQTKPRMQEVTSSKCITITSKMMANNLED